MAGVFALAGRDNITREEHFGVKGFKLTASVPYGDVLAVKGLWAPPYASSDFVLEVRLAGERVPTDEYSWDGNSCERQGRLGELEVSSSFVVPMEGRAAALEVTVTNAGAQAVTVPVQIVIRGAVDEVSFWEFSGPGCSERETPWAERALAWQSEAEMVVKRKEGRALAVATDLPMARWKTLCGHWEGTLTLEAGEMRRGEVVVAMGPEAVEEAEALLAAGAGGVQKAREEWRSAVAEVFERVPGLEASDERLEMFYNRSLVGLLLNQWRVPEFVTQPYYSTGGINGGCVCCYLWDFGEPWEIMPLYDPEAVRTHVRQFLSVDLTRHFAWVPTTGEAFGPWYPVNQEKIIFLVYNYVLATGDTDFLAEEVAGKTALEWMLYHATYRDNQELPVALIDYGRGNNHLELRGTYRYDNYLPDLNARRYGNMLAAYELSKLGGKPAEQLPQRAQELKALIKRTMWDGEKQWFWNLGDNFEKQTSFNVQMFKPIGSGVLDEEELEGLLSHLNDGEFLSAWGLHSMSKLDPAYDQVDIDNGGGGNYTAFTPQIIERLYKVRRAELAEDILQRILWWGARMPYWGDSIVANQVEYRQDTPLQNTIGALAGAQAIIFGMFGVQVSAEGAVTVDPQPPSFSPRLKLTGLRLRGRCLDIEVGESGYTVWVDGKVRKGELGTAMVVG
ncbi:MAG: hypothetical protein ABFE08_08105 [Armatimonadia bacterium]